MKRIVEIGEMEVKKPKTKTALDILKTMYKKLKNERDNGERSMLCITSKKGETEIYGHATRKDVTLYVLALIEGGYVDEDVVDKLLELRKLKRIL